MVKYYSREFPEFTIEINGKKYKAIQFYFQPYSRFWFFAVGKRIAYRTNIYDCDGKQITGPYLWILPAEIKAQFSEPEYNDIMKSFKDLQNDIKLTK